MSGILKASQLHQLLYRGYHDLNSDTLKLALMDENFDPAMEDNNNWTDISGDECSGTGYTAGGKALTTLAFVYDGAGNCKLTADNVTWTGLDVGEISYCVLVNTTPSVYHVLAYWELDVTVEGSDFTVAWHDDGVLSFGLSAGVYQSYFSYLLDGAIDLRDDTLKVMLVKNYNPDPVNDVKYSDVSGSEVSGSGYTAGGEELTSPVSYTYNRIVEPDDSCNLYMPDDVEWAALDSDTPSHAIIYDSTHADKPLLFHFPVAAAPDGGPYRLEWPDDVPDPIYSDILHDGVWFTLEQ